MDYDSLQTIGAMMGSGGLIVMDTSCCMVDVARFFMEFCRDESCGKCVPCRAGTVQMHDILPRITHGEGVKSAISEYWKSCPACCARQPVRSRHGRAKPGAEHSAPFPRRV